MPKKFYVLIAFIALCLVTSKEAPSSYAQTCDEYCQSASRYGYCTNEGNPNPYECITTYYEYCGTDPTILCYCCLNPITPPAPSTPPPVPPTSTPPVATVTPSFSVCTGTDGNDPCTNYSCSPYPSVSDCLQHGGMCNLVLSPPLSPYDVYICSPTTCTCGESAYDCPYDLHGAPPPDYAWTCKSDITNTTCSEDDDDNTSLVSCSPGYLNCTLGAAQVPCINSEDCVLECGSDPLLTTCNWQNICYVTSTCVSLPPNGESGTCVSAEDCPDDRTLPQLDCGPTTICCAPLEGCTGIFGNSGECYFLQCPPEYYFEGINPPMDEIGCPPLFACCTQPGDDWIERNTLNPQCTTSTGRIGIKTAVGCIGVQNQNELLSFILPWAIGVGSGTAFILMIVAGFLVMTSAGNPQRAKAGKELLGAAIAGLLMIIFSVYILDIIGLRIFKILGL